MYDNYYQYVYAQKDAKALERLADIEEAAVDANRGLLSMAVAYYRFETPLARRLLADHPARPSPGGDDYIGRLQSYVTGMNLMSSRILRAIDGIAIHASSMGARA